MSKYLQHFSASGYEAMRVARLSVARTALCRCLASHAGIDFVPARSYAKVFNQVTGRQCTPSDNLPQLPQLGLKKLGQRKPNKHAMPQLPQPAPTVFNMYQMEKEAARRVWCAGRELNSRHKTGYMQRNRATFQGTPWAFFLRVIRTPINLICAAPWLSQLWRSVVAIELTNAKR